MIEFELTKMRDAAYVQFYAGRLFSSDKSLPHAGKTAP